VQWPRQRNVTEVFEDVAPTITTTPSPLATQPSGTYLKSDIQSCTRHLEEFILGPIDPHQVHDSAHIFAEHQISYAIQSWSSSTNSQALWIMGPADRHYPSTTSLLAAALVNSADEAGAPCVHIFIDWPVSESAILTSVLYSLIRQLITLLPESIVTTVQLGSERFAFLDGIWSKESSELGLELVKDLLDLSPSLSLIIIDGIEHLDYLSIGACFVENLLNVFAQHSKTAGDKTFKILFTTAGNCASLNILDEEYLKIVKASDLMSRQPGKGGPGQSEVVGLGASAT
jgi:hypothetical protein